ncbi:MAG: M48 family metallopeptidase [Nocardioidaceae bacterium]
MKFTVRAMLAVALLVGVYVLAAVVALVLVAVVGVLIALAFHLHATSSPLAIAKVVLVSVGVVAGLARALLFLHGRRQDEPAGIPLDPDDHPRLWSEIRELAGAVGTWVPDEIRLTAEANASAEDTSRLLGLVGGERRLYLGMPALLGLTTEELRAVIAHELGHFSGRHGALGTVTYRGMLSMARIHHELGRGSRVGRLFAGYARMYERVSLRVNRRQETEADSVSAKVTGSQALASALRALLRVDLAWQVYLATYLQPGVALGLRGTPFLECFELVLNNPARQRDFRERADRAASQSSALDSHPSINDRIAAVTSTTAVVTPAEPSDAVPAIYLLDDPGETLHRLEHLMFEAASLEPVPWDAFADATGAATAREMTDLLVRAAQGPVPEEGSGEPHARRELSVLTLLESMQDGEIAALCAPVLNPELTDSDREAALADLVVGYMARALVDAGLARFVIDWSAGSRLVTTAGGAIDLTSLVRRAVADGSLAINLAQALEDLGADESLRPVTGRASDPVEGLVPHESRIVAVVTSVQTAWNHRSHLIVLDSGLLFTQLRWWESARAQLSAIGSKRSAQRLVERLLAAPVESLLARPEATFAGYGDIRVDIRFQRFRGQMVRVTGARRVAARVTADSVVYGAPFAAIEQSLGQRCTWRRRRPKVAGYEPVAAVEMSAFRQP